MSRRRWMWLVGLALLGGLVHALAARAMVDHGVAGALLAGGGGYGTVLAAAGFLLLRLVGFVALGGVPALVLWWSWPSHGGRTRSGDTCTPTVSASGQRPFDSST